jgi:phospholipid transport system transporter-binding protein
MANPGTLPALETLNFANAKTALEQGRAAIRAGQSVIDLGAVKLADSSGVAVLLGWQRAAREAGVALAFVNLPASLQSLATLYGVDEFLVDSPANLQHH